MNAEHHGFKGVAVLALIAGLAACSSDDDPSIRGGTGGTGSGDVAPVAVDDGPYVVIPGSSLTVSASNGVLANDVLPGTLQSVSVVSQPTHTSTQLALSADGGFTYRHSNLGSDSRTDSFVYELLGADGQTSQASVQVVANTAPAAMSDFFDAQQQPQCFDVLQNDVDADSDALTLTGVFDVSSGFGIPVIRDNQVCLSPGSASEAQFDYSVEDNFGAEDSATVFVRFQGASNPDIFAKNDEFTVARGGTLKVVRPGTLLNDEVDANPATQNPSARVELVPGREPRQHDDRAPTLGGAGTFALDSDGGFFYVHDGSDQEVDTFDYILVEGQGADTRRSSLATVSIRILEAAENEAPRARDEVVKVNPSSTVDVPVLYNDTDREDGVPVFLAIENEPACGIVSTDFIQVQGSPAPLDDNLGIVRYVHDPSRTNCRIDGDIEQTDSFSYSVIDSNGATDQATVTVRINSDENRAPTAANDEVGTPADQTVHIQVLQNDFDVDGDLVVLQLADGLDADDVNGCDGGAGLSDEDDECNTQRATGEVSFIPETGVIVYKPVSTDIVAPPYTDVFEYKINDGRGLTARASVTVNVRGAALNQGPVACDEPTDDITQDDPPSGCIDIQDPVVQLFSVPACATHELALNILINDTDSDPEDRPPYRFDSTDPSADDNPPRHVFHAPADTAFGVGALRISEAPTVTGTGSSSDPNNGRRSVVRISDDGRFIYYQNIGAENTNCAESSFTDTFTYVVTDGKGKSDEGLVRVSVVADRAGSQSGVAATGCAGNSVDCDADGVPNAEDQCPRTPVFSSSAAQTAPQTGTQTSTPSDTVFTNGCLIIPTGDSLINDTRIDSDGDGVRGTDDACPNTVGNGPDGCPLAVGDSDGDTIDDSVDNCPNVPNGPNEAPDNQVDTDGDNVGDACDEDDDNDGVLDTNDNCPVGPGPEGDNTGDDRISPEDNQNDVDNDGMGDICDPDNDGDGVPDNRDQCPNNAGTGLGLINPGCPGL